MQLEELEAEVAELRQQLEQVQAMNAEKLEKAADALSSMEKRAVLAESMLEATILSQETANSKAHGTIRSTQDDSPQEGIHRSHSSPSPMYSSHSLL
jgi:acetylglutamate kinase